MITVILRKLRVLGGNYIFPNRGRSAEEKVVQARIGEAG